MDGGPLYLQIAQTLEGDIEAGVLQVGEKLESERVLSERMGVSRMTARQALRHLHSKGLVETRTGHGTFVGDRRIEQKLETLTGFTDEMARQGRSVGSIVVSSQTRTADRDSARALGLPAGGQVHALSRVRFADGIPVALETTEVIATHAPGLLELEDFGTSSLYATLSARFGIVPTRAEQTLMADLADQSIARTLNIENGQPVLKLTRLTLDQDGNVFEYVRSTYRGDFFVMKVELSLADGSKP